MKLSKHFSLEEFIVSPTANRLNINNVPGDEELENLKTLVSEVLEPLREAYGKPIRVTSGFRCKKLNDAIGGSKSSQHMLGQAADITSLEDSVEGNKELFDIAVKLIRQGVITVGQLINEYNYNWVHISTPTYNKTNQILKVK
jgi:hypothetical protein